MDQERDTTQNPKSSRRGPFWVENGLPNPTPGDLSASGGYGSGNRQHGGFQEISAAAARIDAAAAPAGERLPTLFELPDRTPEGLERKRQKNQFIIHDAHAGPPASHVDPPSGNHSFLRHNGPKSPISTDSFAPEDDAETSDGAGDGMRSDTTRIDAPDDRRVAAYRDEPMKWSDEHKSSWATRSAIVMLMLMMVTLAFFSGRRFDKPADPADDFRLTDSDAADLGDTVVVITEDAAVIDDMVRRETDADVNDPPSYAAYPPPTAESTGTSTEPQRTSATSSPLVGPSATDLVDQPGLPAAFDSMETTVAFRSAATETAKEDAASDMPATETPSTPSLSTQGRSTDLNPAESFSAGMEDRLRYDDLYQYTDTPHLIGNFLEILKVWEENN